MWQDWVNGVLGLWIILMPFLGFDPNLHRTIMIVTGVIIAVLAFWAAMGSKSSSGSGMM